MAHHFLHERFPPPARTNPTHTAPNSAERTRRAPTRKIHVRIRSRARANPSRYPGCAFSRTVDTSGTLEPDRSITKTTKRTQPPPQRAWRAGGISPEARTNPRTASRSLPQDSHKRIAARGTNEPTLAPCHYSKPQERKRNRHERTDAREWHERIVQTVGVAVPVSPSPARRRRRPRSSPPPGYPRRHAAGPWCGHRSTGSPACRRRRRSGPW
jgi:hypothetical protein